MPVFDPRRAQRAQLLAGVMRPFASPVDTNATLLAAQGQPGEGQGALGGMEAGGGLAGLLGDMGGGGDDDSGPAGWLKSGASAAGGDDMGGDGGHGLEGGGTGDMNWRGDFMEMIKKQMQAGGEDKALALAKAGFGMAASGSPHLGVAIGQGAVYGLEGLEKLKAQRAQERLRRDALAQQAGLQIENIQARKDAIQAQKDAAAAAHFDRQAANARQAAADKQTSIDRQDALDVRRDALQAAGEAKGEAAKAAAETHYQTQANNRTKTFYTTGVWQDLPGDKDHGVDGAPTEGTEYEGPLVTSPKLSLKQKQAIEAEKPAAVSRVGNAVQSFDLMDKAVDDILKHPGLSGTTGASGVVLGRVPGTDWKDAKSLIESLKNKTATAVLTNLRAASKTGGALGNVSNADIELLKNNIASLDTAQSEEQVIQQLKEIQNFAREAGGRQRTAFVQTYGDKDAPKLPWENRDDPAAKKPDALSRAEELLKAHGH